MVNGGFATCKFPICTVSPLNIFAERDFATYYLQVFATCKFAICIFATN